jgi:hypothetical protein
MKTTEAWESGTNSTLIFIAVIVKKRTASLRLKHNNIF